MRTEETVVQVDTNAETAEDGHVARLGALIKERRVGRYTIEALAARAGLSAGSISQLERGIGNPSFGTLVRLSYALDIPLAAMFEGSQVDERQMLVRRGERLRLVVPGDGTVHEILAPSGTHRLGLMSTVFPPGFASPDSPNSHPGEEIVLVVSGTIEATIGGEVFVLNEGDSLGYDSSLPHLWANRTDKPAEVLLISTPPASNIAR